jgi:gamma-glutamylcyclotransferase (GGCT)/AIG2-like uncharacterized protein YtfP
MNEKALFFVYGTLKVGGYYAGSFDKVRKSVHKAVAENKSLFSVHGNFPAMVPGEGQVHGEVHEYDDVASVILAMDRIEGEGSLYARRRGLVTLEDGREVEANYYEFLHPTDKLEKIENGVWEI